MDSIFNNIDEAFKGAFQHAEAPFSPSEIHADWSKVSHQIPSTPAPHTPGAHQVGPHLGSGIGKIIGFSGMGAAVIVAAVILYNIYVKPQKKENLTDKIQIENKISESQNRKPETKQGTEIAANNLKSDLKVDAKTEGKSVVSTNPVNKTANDQTSSDQTTRGYNQSINPNQNPAPVKGNNNIAPAEKRQQVPFNIQLSEPVICVNQTLTVNASSSAGDFTINWGDGIMAPFYANASHVYTVPGRYTVLVENEQKSDRKTITVIERPKAKFSARQNDKLHYTFSNQSASGLNLSWNFGDGSEVEHGFYAVHNYPDTGKYFVRLVATNSGGCSDTFSQMIQVGDYREPQVYPPGNALTPNGDGINDEFYVLIQDETYFNLTIVDRTGQVVFQTSDKNIHWDGKNQKTGAECPDGSYYYSITYSYRNNSEPRMKRDAIFLTRTMLR